MPTDFGLQSAPLVPQMFYLADLPLDLSGVAHMTPGLLALAGHPIGPLLLLCRSDEDEDEAGDEAWEGPRPMDEPLVPPAELPSPRPALVPEPPAGLEGTCRPQIEVHLGGISHDGRSYTDFEVAELPDKQRIGFAQRGPTADSQLGKVEGVYDAVVKLPDASGQKVDQRVFLGIGYYYKTEAHITITLPSTPTGECKISSVRRLMRSLPGHNAGPPHGWIPDKAIPARSIAVQSPQYWIVTDAPGFRRWLNPPQVFPGNVPVANLIQNFNLLAPNRTFNKEYELIATFSAGTRIFERRQRYTVRFRTDAAGKIIP